MQKGRDFIVIISSRGFSYIQGPLNQVLLYYVIIVCFIDLLQFLWIVLSPYFHIGLKFFDQHNIDELPTLVPSLYYVLIID